MIGLMIMNFFYLILNYRKFELWFEMDLYEIFGIFIFDCYEINNVMSLGFCCWYKNIFFYVFGYNL